MIIEEKKQFFRPQTCRNCGNNGHLYKDCVHPIMSFGIICYKIEADEIKYIMIQRKDSLSFMEFIRGKYNVNEKHYIINLINCMTYTERNMLYTKTFDEIWIYANNSSASDEKLTIEYGGTTSPDNLIELTISAESGLVLVVPGLTLSGDGSSARTVSAFSENGRQGQHDPTSIQPLL